MPAASARIPPLSKPLVIAIVDDDEAVRDALCDLLQVEGLSTRSFASAAAFLAGDRRDDFACLITDVRMPGMDGLELQEMLRARGSSTPVIFLTSLTDEDARARALRDGARAWLTKPADDDKVLAAIQAALATHGTTKAQSRPGYNIMTAPLFEAARKNAVLPVEGLLPGAGGANQAAKQDDMAAWWALDISDARAVIASVASGTGPVSWIDALLAVVRIADVDQNLIHLVGPYAGRQRMIGQPVTAYWPAESWPTLAELIVAAVTTHAPGATLTREVTSLAFANCTITLSTHEDGAHPDIVFVSVRGTVVDDRSLWLVRASEERYRNLIHHLPTALLQVDSTAMIPIFDKLRLEGITDMAVYLAGTPELPLHSRNIVKVTDANRKAVELFAAAGSEQLIGAVDFVFAASPATAHRVITAHFDGRRSYSELIRLRRFDGALRDVHLSVTYPTPPERLDVTLLSFEDVTDRLRTEVQLRQLQADYTRAARISMLGQLATSIAHEINQPLSAIVTNAETSLRWLSREDPNLAKVGQLTSRIAASARHASDIVQRIRAMAARRTPERVLLDLNKIVDEALLFVRHEIEFRSINLTVRLDRDLPPVLGDRVQLQQVIVNLLLNAVQALAQGDEPKGRIDVNTANGANGAVVFTIGDDGPGITDENLDRLFDSFFTTKDDGMGIGLAICQSIIAAHGGTIGASNHPAGGALFRLSLPAAT